jgi:acyl-CoA-binding protein
VLLQIYGLYKQATVGDNTGAQPWAVQVEARAKWEAWTSQKGTLPAFLAGARLT